MFESQQHQQWQQARSMLEKNHVDDAKRLLHVLANQNFAPALNDLATILLMQADNEQSAQNASKLLEQAALQNYAPAIYQLASLSITDSILALDWSKVSKQLINCCQKGHPNALCDVALFLARYGDSEQQLMSTQLLELSALRGNIVAMALLGERLASGYCCDPDLARANSIRRLARELDLPVPEPDPRYASIDPEPAQTPILPASLDIIELQNALHFASGDLLDKRINLQIFQSFFSTEECLYICCLGGPHLKPSISVDPNGMHHKNQIRTSFDFIFLPEQEDIYLKLLQWRMAIAAGVPLKNAEPLTLLRYLPGQEYKPHRDYLPASHFVPVSKGGAGQRISTAIVYLNNPKAGGQTAFPLLQQIIPATEGKLLLFNSLTDNGQLNESSLHAGQPVISGVKWICTLWLREMPLRLQ